LKNELENSRASFMPICIDVSETRIVVIGGGNVALQKLRSIIKYAANVHVYAKNILSEIKALPVHCVECAYEESQLHGAGIVYACTNDPELNHRVYDDGKKAGALVSAAGTGNSRDFISPAIFRHEDMTVAINSNGRHIKKSVHWRDAVGHFIRDTLISGKTGKI
jgi:precorrin-2 dehydrogenase/sirohydrochlorin ferrochelatase